MWFVDSIRIVMTGLLFITIAGGCTGSLIVWMLIRAGVIKGTHESEVNSLKGEVQDLTRRVETLQAIVTASDFEAKRKLQIEESERNSEVERSAAPPRLYER